MIKVTRSAVIDAPIARVWAILRDFNSHIAWHPAIAESYIENNEAADQVGCVRAFTLKDGNRLREQLLTLSDRQYLATYCILDATLPMQRYVATVQLKPVTDGEHTFWHWQSTFDVPAGREAEFEALVGGGVYEGGFEGLRAYLRSPASRITPHGNSHGMGVSSPNAVKSPSSRASSPTQAIVVAQHGGAEVMRYQSVPVNRPGPGEVTIRHTAIGVNYIDVYVRTGAYPMMSVPGTPGMEAAGIIEEVGDGVAHLLPGDRVAYACAPVGAYAARRTMSAAQLVVLPDSISDEQGAALMLKGMTAEYLLHRTHRVKAGDWILVHAAAGGVGLFTCQWAKALGARVVGTVSSTEKARLAREHGCEFPIVTAGSGFAQEVLRLTDNRGVSVVYDGNGAATFDESLEALALCGHLVSFGQASGRLAALDLARLSAKSLTLTRPVLFHYTAQRSQLLDMAGRVFEAVQRGLLRVPIHHRYPLASAAEAHKALESRQTTGAIVLLP
jgi:NADPH:quinone reductase